MCGVDGVSGGDGGRGSGDDDLAGDDDGDVDAGALQGLHRLVMLSARQVHVVHLSHGRGGTWEGGWGHKWLKLYEIDAFMDIGQKPLSRELEGERASEQMSAVERASN